MAKKPRLRSGFTLGGEQAEADPLLETAFFETNDYRVIESRKDPRCFVVGRTGSGKSAVLQRLEERHAEHTIRINPEDLSLPYITDLHVIRHLNSLGVNLDLFWIALWKHVLIVEILRHRYRLSGPEAKQNFMERIREKIRRDPAKLAALAYLDEFEGKFWCETDERVRDITDKFSRSLTQNAGISVAQSPLNIEAGFDEASLVSIETRRQQADRYQRIVNNTQLAKLNKMLDVVNDDILDEQNFVYVVVDDLDRDWVDEQLANDLVRCLFRTVLDLKRVRNLKVLVALRTNIFRELDFGRKSGGQEEKFRSLVLSLAWTRRELESLLDERVQIAAAENALEARTVSDLLPSSNHVRGNPIDYILDRTLLRPRDAIAYLNECLAKGLGRTRLSWDDIKDAELEYSVKRLLALRDEWKPTYPGIERGFQEFRGAPLDIEHSAMARILDGIMLLSADPSFPGVRWLTDVSAAMWSPTDSGWFEVYGPLVRLLYELGFLGCLAPKGRGIWYYHTDHPHFCEFESNLNSVEIFSVHRTYRASLDIREAGTPRLPRDVGWE
jgi:hypothetical protein